MGCNGEGRSGNTRWQSECGGEGLPREAHGDPLGGGHGGRRAASLGKGKEERLWEREGSGVGVRERLLGRQIERGRARQERGAG